MAVCSSCGKAVGLFGLSEGKCHDCWQIVFAERAQQEVTKVESEASDSNAAARIILTTETAHNLPVAERLDIVSAEVVIGMHLFKDIAAVWRDAFGGRSKVMQEGLRDARKTALAELRREAHTIGADAVVGVDLDYSEISGGGKSMLFLVASGTAVTLIGKTDAT